jgi:hypothetical protein
VQAVTTYSRCCSWGRLGRASAMALPASSPSLLPNRLPAAREAVSGARTARPPGAGAGARSIAVLACRRAAYAAHAEWVWARGRAH